MSSPIPDPGAVPDEPNFTDLPSNDEPDPREPVVPRPSADDPEPTESA
ncbi:hypothetical protein [Cellulomonas phragmiteti]|uniref:Stereocilin n=1 Tax=Cellulomonas phragmiteti TaxID=478780 RepID=A0ABQ4DPC1_9CELL|nr:hypothetical protein [Cellulomonas phragmiteti]GIG41184.1 hypothetical protein Cph01nite_29460 [Cellulomonas phragmiteti]